MAAAQAESVSGDVEANVGTAVGLVEQAAQQGARVVVLPELFLTGYDPDAWSDQALVRGHGDERLRALHRHAREHAVLVLASGARPGRVPHYVADPPPVRHISVFALGGPDELPSCVYDKQHLTTEEKGFFTAGDHGAGVVVDGWRLGLGVCYDGCFPEHAMAAAADGATAYLCPSAYYVGSEHRRDLYYAARALDNGIYVVFAGLTGRCGTREFNGGSTIYDPEGRPLDRLGREAGIAAADLDTAEIDRVRRLNPIAADRRTSLGGRTWLAGGR
ncbi:MAG: carbon-nitrogen hydrolase family protein [Nocardioidaceae bacterium]